MDFTGVKQYILSKGLTHDDFNISENIKNIEFFVNRQYFCSVGNWDSQSFEVFELHHGAEVSKDGKDWLTDGEIWQYKVYASLKRAIDFALKCLASRKLPDYPLRRW